MFCRNHFKHFPNYLVTHSLWFSSAYCVEIFLKASWIYFESKFLKNQQSFSRSSSLEIPLRISPETLLELFRKLFWNVRKNFLGISPQNSLIFFQKFFSHFYWNSSGILQEFGDFCRNSFRIWLNILPGRNFWSDSFRIFPGIPLEFLWFFTRVALEYS